MSVTPSKNLLRFALRRRPPGNAQEKGIALIVVLALLVLLTFVVVAFFSRATMNRSVENSGAANSAAAILARTSAEAVIADLKSEMVLGSSPTPAPNPNAPFVVLVPLNNQR